MDTEICCFSFILSLGGLALSCCNRNYENEQMESSGPEIILRHCTSLYTSIAFHVGMQLEIFTVLDKGPLRVAEAAALTQMKPFFLERLFYSLVACKMLTVQKDVFANTPVASRYLVKGKPDYMGDHVWVNPFLKQWVFQAALTTAESLKAGSAVNKFDYAESTFEQLLSVFRGTMPVAASAGKGLARLYDFCEFTSVVDIGGASGGLSVSLKRSYPHLNITVTDLPTVTPVTRALLEEQRIDEIEIMDWDVSQEHCGQSFDAAVLRTLIQVLSPEQAVQTLINVCESVNPGGTIFILGRILDDSKFSPPEEAAWYLLNLNWEDHAGFYTEREYKDILRNAGFQGIQRDILPNGDGLILARKPS